MVATRDATPVSREPKRVATAGKRGAVELVRQTVKDIGEADVPGLAAEMAHHSLFALFSFFLLLAGLVAISDDVFGIQDMRERLVSSAQDVLPQNASSLVEGFLNDVVDSKGQGALIFGLFGVAWAGSNLVGSAMKGLNRILRTEEHRGSIERKLLAIALALVLGVMMVAATIVIVFQGTFVDGLDDMISRGAAEFVMTAVVWPVALLVVALAAAILYWKGPDRDEPFRWVTPGALLFAVGWVVASIAASIYLSESESANRTYGLIAAILAAIVWLYWSNLLFLAGAVLNARVEDARMSRSSEQRTEQSAQAQP
jgi:membrane protein